MSKARFLNCLKILEVKPGTSLEEIEKTYEELIQVWHPDGFTNNQKLRERANKKIKEIHQAYDYICQYCEEQKFDLDYIDESDGDFKKEPKLVDEQYEIIQLLQDVSGMTYAHPRDFPKARVFITCKSGLDIRIWKNSLGVDHVFVADKHGQMIFSGFVGWIHSNDLFARLSEIQRRFG